MIIIGLTGSVGMGKSTAAAMLNRMGIPICDSDALVHSFMAKGGAAIPRIKALFPDVIKDGAVDRPALGKIVFGDTAALRKLEQILHPMVRQSQRDFLKQAQTNNRAFAVLDVPLLFEGGIDALCDYSIVVTAPAFLQRQRVMSRPGMTEARFQGTLNHQMADYRKRQRADFVVQTGLNRYDTLTRLTRIIALLSLSPPGNAPAKWGPGWAGKKLKHARNRS
jgi:dephospho-CoA kinase